MTIRAVNGGEIDLSTLTQIIHTGVSAESYIRAVGRNSLVNLGGLTRFITQGGTSELRVADNGTIQAPNLNQQQNLNVINDGGTIVLPMVKYGVQVTKFAELKELKSR
ncbi:MAG: hypothetical protein Q6K99_07950 [Thermostichales cyanobacterium BF4_bins_65]